jgi:hypothetical protein
MCPDLLVYPPDRGEAYNQKCGSQGQPACTSRQITALSHANNGNNILAFPLVKDGLDGRIKAGGGSAKL